MEGGEGVKQEEGKKDCMGGNMPCALGVFASWSLGGLQRRWLRQLGLEFFPLGPTVGGGETGRDEKLNIIYTTILHEFKDAIFR